MIVIVTVLLDAGVYVFVDDVIANPRSAGDGPAAAPGMLTMPSITHVPAPLTYNNTINQHTETLTKTITPNQITMDRIALGRCE